MNLQKKKKGTLIIDAGSSSIRASIIDYNAISLFSSKITYSVIEYPDGRVEQTYDLFVGKLIDSVSEACAYAIENNIEISAVSVTAQRSSVVAIDRDGKPLCNFIMWHDKRTVEICNEINSNYDIYSICGMTATHVYSAPKISWIYRNRRDIYDRTYKFIGVQDLLIYTMTGNLVTDVSFASRTALLDIKELIWSDELLKLFNVDQEKLCTLISVGSKTGEVTNTFSKLTGLKSGIPVYSAGGDQQCAALGLCVTKHGQVMVNTGTGAYVVAMTDNPILDKNKNVLCNVSAIEGKWILEASSMSSGMVFNWYNDNFYRSDKEKSSFETIEKDIMSSRPGANGIVMIPSLLGKGTPYWNSYIRGMFFNVSFRNTRADFARAMIEGLAAELSDCVGLFEKLMGKTDEIISSGGLTKFSEYNHILADTIGKSIKVSSQPETTTQGAWISLVTALGIYDNYKSACEVTQRNSSEIIQCNEENHKKYLDVNVARNILIESLDYKKLNKLLTN